MPRGGGLLGWLAGVRWYNTARIGFLGIELAMGRNDRIETSEVADSPFRYCFWVTNGDGAWMCGCGDPISGTRPVFEVAVVVSQKGSVE